MKSNLKKRIINVMSSVFERPIDKITNDSSQDTIESWDSLKHMNLIVSLEEEFEIELTDDEILEMSNYKLIKEIIGSY